MKDGARLTVIILDVDQGFEAVRVCWLGAQVVDDHGAFVVFPWNRGRILASLGVVGVPECELDMLTALVESDVKDLFRGDEMVDGWAPLKISLFGLSCFERLD